MEIVNDIRWIHLSDLHMGCEENKWTDDTLRKELIYYLENDLGRIDFILISGDVIHQGQYNNRDICEQANSFLSVLSKKFENIIFCVGNHDYLRNRPRYDLLKQWQLLDNKEKRKQEDEYAKKLCADFENYVNLCRSNSENNPIQNRTYIYQGIDGVNIIILNTSIFCGQPVLKEGEMVNEGNNVQVDDFQKLWIPEHELPTVDQINSQFPTIVFGHHPIEMFEDDSRKRLEEFLTRVNAEYLCGHIHEITSATVNDIHQTSSAGLFKGRFNDPSFSYNILRKNRNEKIEKRYYEYSKNGWIQKCIDRGKKYKSLKNIYVYNSLDEATPDIANDIETSDILYFYGLQASSFSLESPYIGSAIKRNENLDIKLLISNPYNIMVINRIQQMPKYKDILSVLFNKKWNNIKDEVMSKDISTLKNMKIKHHNYPLVFRSIITSKYLYIGLYENKDSSESMMYRFTIDTEMYQAMKMHFESTWVTASEKVPKVIPAKYRIFDRDNKFFVTPSLVINVTDECNMNCKYCPDGGENLEEGLSLCDISAVKRLIQVFKKSIKNNESAVLRITGGEPFLAQVAERTIEILREARNNNYDKIVLCTNGYNFGDIYRNQGYKNVLESVKDTLLLKISLDSLNENNFYSITETKALARVKNNIILASQLDFKIELNVVATKYNIYEMMDLYKFASEHNLVGIKILTVNDFGNRVDLKKVIDDSTNINLMNLVKELQMNKAFTSHTNVFLNDNKGVAMKKFEDQQGCMITIVDHNNSDESITPRRVFCEDCRYCEYYPLSNSVIEKQIKPCATGIMSLTMRQDGMLSFCRLRNSGKSIDTKNKKELENIVKAELKHFDSCFVYRATMEK